MAVFDMTTSDESTAKQRGEMLSNRRTHQGPETDVFRSFSVHVYMHVAWSVEELNDRSNTTLRSWLKPLHEPDETFGVFFYLLFLSIVRAFLVGR